MTLKHPLTSALLAFLLSSFSSGAENVDWDKIQFWTGSGPNRAALVVQFLDMEVPEAYVWGYMWQSGETPTGEDMLRAIAADSPDLTVLTQRTGGMGSTLCGLGYSDNQAVLDEIYFDFGSALSDKNINFGYLNPNTGFGQSSAPGGDAPTLCENAVEAARTSHVIQHPFGKDAYGYPAYDYDHWIKKPAYADSESLWQSGWYDGYWSYWSGGVDLSRLTYSGAGMTSSPVSNGSVNAWSFQPLGGVVGDGYRPQDVDWAPLNYLHYGNGSGPVSINEVTVDGSVATEFYTLDGVRLSCTDRSQLPAGIYIERHGNECRKLITK